MYPGIVYNCNIFRIIKYVYNIKHHKFLIHNTKKFLILLNILRKIILYKFLMHRKVETLTEQFLTST